MTIAYPQFNPVALQIGPVAIHWYGLTYLVAFVLFIWLGSIRVKLAQFASRDWSRRDQLREANCASLTRIEPSQINSTNATR